MRLTGVGRICALGMRTVARGQSKEDRQMKSVMEGDVSCLLTEMSACKAQRVTGSSRSVRGSYWARKAWSLLSSGPGSERFIDPRQITFFGTSGLVP